MGQEEKVTKGTRIFSKILTVIIVFLVLICLILFFKIVTNSDVSIFGMRFYYVATESMYPTIKPYSLIAVKDVNPDTLQTGDIISFVSRDESIYGLINTHRIVDIVEEDGQKAFVTKGDNNPTADANLVYPDEIVGKVVGHTPPIKVLTSILSFAGTPIGFLIVIILPLVFILMMILSSFLRSLRENMQLQEEEARKKAELYEQNIKKIEETTSKIEGEAADAESERQAAIIILEMYFGKKLNEITEKDIEEKLSKL